MKRNWGFSVWALIKVRVKLRDCFGSRFSLQLKEMALVLFVLLIIVIPEFHDEARRKMNELHIHIITR